MKNKVRFIPSAVKDLESIYRFIERERSARTAASMIRRIHKSAGSFATQPGAGASCDDLFETGRYFVVDPYVVYYRPFTDGIEIVQVIHGAQDIAQWFRLPKKGE
jgi:toxin ParE1/3/4